MQGALLKFLELVQRELEADDARVEIGGRDPDDERLLWCPLPNGWRLVASFATAPGNKSAVQQRLEHLAESFSGLPERANQDVGELPREPMLHRVDDELETLALRAGAVAAVVTDDTSPVLWGTSTPRRDAMDVTAALAIARWTQHARQHGLALLELLELPEAELDARLLASAAPEAERGRIASHVAKLRQRGERSAAAWRRQLLLAQGIHRVRHASDDGEPTPARFMLQEDDLGVLSRSFANIYRTTLVFPGPFSEIQADGALLHVLPLIERLVLALPPVDPEPTARILRLSRRP